MMIDLYGGAGTYASWPARVRAYGGNHGGQHPRLGQRLRLSAPPRGPSAVTLPTLVAYGGASHPAVQRANALLGECMPAARSAIIEGAAHFMIATHPEEVARRVADHVQGVLAGSAAAEPAVSGSGRD